MGYICAVQTSSHAASAYIGMYRESAHFHRVFGQIIPFISLLDNSHSKNFMDLKRTLCPTSQIIIWHFSAVIDQINSNYKVDIFKEITVFLFWQILECQKLDSLLSLGFPSYIIMQTIIQPVIKSILLWSAHTNWNLVSFDPGGRAIWRCLIQHWIGLFFSPGCGLK